MAFYGTIAEVQSNKEGMEMFFQNKITFSTLIPYIQNLKYRNNHNRNLIIKIDVVLSKMTVALDKNVIDSDTQKDIYKSFVEAYKEHIKENAQNEAEKVAIDVACKVAKRTIEKSQYGNLF